MLPMYAKFSMQLTVPLIGMPPVTCFTTIVILGLKPTLPEHDGTMTGLLGLTIDAEGPEKTITLLGVRVTLERLSLRTNRVRVLQPPVRLHIPEGTIGVSSSSLLVLSVHCLFAGPMGVVLNGHLLSLTRQLPLLVGLRRMKVQCGPLPSEKCVTSTSISAN